MPGQSHPSHARFLLASLLWHQMLRGEKCAGKHRRLGSTWKDFGGQCDGVGWWPFWHWAPREGAPGWWAPHHVRAPSLVFWHALGQRGKLLWGHLLGFQNIGSPQIWHYIDTNSNLTQIMMQPVTQAISIIIGKEIAKGGPWAVGGRKEIFSSN